MDSEPTPWEYQTVRPERESTMKEARDPTDRLTDLGAEGWELVTTLDYVDGGTKFLVLKRPAGRDEADTGNEDGSHE